jgi:hypothetical protein
MSGDSSSQSSGTRQRPPPLAVAPLSPLGTGRAMARNNDVAFAVQASPSRVSSEQELPSSPKPLESSGQSRLSLGMGRGKGRWKDILSSLVSQRFFFF